MADDTASSSAAPPPREDLSINISIVSPSLSVNSPLSFSGLPASTTVGQLKQKIRDTLDSKPSNEQQRLIHQGKLLSKEHESFLEVFGEQRVRDTDQFVVHLVIRDVQDHHTSSSPSTAPPGQNPSLPRHPPQPTAPPQLHGPPRHRVFAHRVPVPGHAHSPFPVPAFGGMPTPPGHTPPQTAAQQQQLLQQYMNQLNQRAGMAPGEHVRGGIGGSHPIPDQTASILPSLGSAAQGRNSPYPEPQHQSYVREGVGPHGEFYRVTMNSALIGPDGQVHPMNLPNFQPGNAGAPGPGGPLSANEVQNILRNGDANQATSMMTNAMHRSASGASLANLNLGSQRQPIQAPGVTVPRRPGSTVPLSRTATPDAMRTPSHGSSSAQAIRTSTPNQPEVYILSSPQGPRALLINGPSDLYYTPAPRVAAPPMIPHFTSALFQTQPRAASGAEAQAPQAPQQPPQQAPQQGNVRVNLYQAPAGQQAAGQQQARMPPLAPAAAPMHPANPEGGLAGALLGALWPHVWLLIRLAVIVWWFTSAETSWTRWLMIMFLATALFLINTGLFNGMANDLFQPVRQHLEGLIPFAGPERRNNAPAQEGDHNGPAPHAEQRRGELDPAQVAARLVEQRRDQNANWLLDHIRRVERASLLLLASILPGVAERHIARLEAEARAERERQEAAERAERERREEEERAAASASAVSATGEEEGAGDADGDQQNGDVLASGSGGTEQQPQDPVAAA